MKFTRQAVFLARSVVVLGTHTMTRWRRAPDGVNHVGTSGEHDQVEKCRWAELGELDFVQLQHLWQKVVTWKAEPGGEKGGEHHRSPIVEGQRLRRRGTLALLRAGRTSFGGRPP